MFGIIAGVLLAVLAASPAQAVDLGDLVETEFAYLLDDGPPGLAPAERLYLEGKWLAAAAEYEKTPKALRTPEIMDRIGTAYLYAGENAKARKAFRATLAAHKDDGYARVALLVVDLITARKSKKADIARDLTALRETYGGEGWYGRLMGLGLLRGGARDAALEYFKSAVEKDPRDYMSWFFIGIVHELRLDFDEAMEPYRKSVTANPIYAQAVNNLGYNYKERHYFSYARVHYERAIELDPTNAGYWYNVGNIYNHARMTREANDRYRRAASLDPKFHKAHYNLGKTSVRLGYLEEGVRELKAYTKLWKPFLSERDVPNPEDVEVMIEEAEDLIVERDAIAALDDPVEKAKREEQFQIRLQTFFGGDIGE
jgi:tetratricopeptide (TPR) repeat protein